MIDIEKCRSCTAICELTQQGLGQKAINAIASSANFGAEATCRSGPEQMEGGWTHCGTSERVQGALEGAAAALALEATAIVRSQENLVTV